MLLILNRLQYGVNVMFPCTRNLRASLVAQQLRIGLSFPGSSVVKNPPAMQETGFNPWVGKIPMEKQMGIHSSILSWEIPWTRKPGRVGHNLVAKQ